MYNNQFVLRTKGQRRMANTMPVFANNNVPAGVSCVKTGSFTVTVYGVPRQATAYIVTVGAKEYPAYSLVGQGYVVCQNLAYVPVK